MRIDDLNRASVTQSTEQSAQIAQQPTAEKAPLGKESVAGSDQAEVSQLAQSLTAPDSGRIDQLRLEVQSGSYEVSSDTVASALIEAHLSQ
jgi:flagellar biosynthesis anti-sigma factor FlgM